MSDETSTVLYDPEERFLEALTSYEEARDAGLNPDPEEWLARYPDVAEHLREHFANEARVKVLVEPPPPEAPAPPLDDCSAAESPEGKAEALRAGLAAERRQSEAEVREALRQRLRAVALLLAIGIAIARGVGLAFAYPRLLADPLSAFTQPPCYGNAALVLCLEVLAVVLLAPGRVLSLPRLRALEWLVFAPPALAVAWDGTLDLAALAPTLGEHSGLTVAYAKSLPWVVFMVGYGVLIPNTWRRCAAVVGFFALLALLPDLAVLLGHGTAAGLLVVYLANKVFWLSAAAVIVLYGAHLLEIQSRQAAAARRLGQYLIQELLAVGGMGEVYRAEHVLLRLPRALKVIRPKLAGDAKALRRFEREVRETAKLTHPNVVQIYDYGFTGTTFYYVMEYLPGLTLQQLVERHGPQPAARVVHFLRQICGALREAHAAGLIHRDVKPGNVMICERGGTHDFAKLLDFGLVLVRNLPGEPSLMDTDIAGTPAYMAPEQWEGKPDRRADIYALGGVAYFLLTGRPPFTGQSVPELRRAHKEKRPVPLPHQLPDSLVKVVFRCLEKAPEDRFEDAQALEKALDACQVSPPWTAEEAAAWWHPRLVASSGPECGGEATASATP